jgi:HK97 family phage major capsid protein
MAVTTDPRDTLKRIERELAETRDALADAVKERDSARDAFAESGNLSRNSDEYKAAEAAVAEVGQLRDRIAELQELQVMTLKALGSDVPEGIGTLFGDGSPPSPKGAWSAEAALRNEGVSAQLERMASTKMPLGRVQLGEVASREALVASFGTPFAADVTGTPNMRRGDYAGVVPQLRRRLRLLDLITKGTMDQNSLPYTQESGSFTTAAETPEGTLKPEAAITLTDTTADAKTVAHWIKNRKQVLADFPALQSIIEGRLQYGVELRLENQILAGDGTGENIRGILQTSGIGSVSFTTGALVADQALRGITTVFLADAEANAILMHPTDWQSALMVKASGSGEYLSGGPFGVTPQQMWGVPLLPSKAVTQGTALVGDFALGAQLFIREGVVVLLSDSDGTDFTMNRVTILAEMRAALAVFRPAAFVSVALQ